MPYLWYHLGNIQTGTGRTNHPIDYLYLLEVSAAEETARPSTMKVSEEGDTPIPLSNQCMMQPREDNNG